MSSGTEIEDLATPALHDLLRRCERPRALLTAAGMRLSTELQEHFLHRDAEGNKQGFWRSHFWAKVRAATSFRSASDTEAVVGIASSEFVHKLNGGTITAKNGKMLAIPLTSEAKEKGSPRNWTALFSLPGSWSQHNALFVLKTASKVFLARKTGEGKASGIELLYLLKASVTQQADPRALPPWMYLQSAIVDAASAALADEGRLA